MTKRTELNAKVFQYILNCIDGEGYEVEFSTDTEKLQFLATTFKSEYCYPENLRYYGNVQKTLSNWFAGLPSSCNIDFENYKILEIAKSWECIPKNATEKQEDKIISNWFDWMANKTLQLMKKHKVTI
jgi:hypothetical protein